MQLFYVRYGIRAQMLDFKAWDLSTKNNMEEEKVLSLTDKPKQNMQKYMEMNLY